MAVIGASVLRQLISKLFSRSPRRSKAVDLGHLTHLARRYSVEQQQVPKDLLDLVTLKYLEEVPMPPNGQRFVIDRKTVEVRLE
jgi:hypothetical protein